MHNMLTEGTAHIVQCKSKVASAVTGAQAYTDTAATYFDGKHDIDGSDDIVVLGIDGPRPVNHGVRGTSLLSKMHNCIWLEAGENIFQKLPVADVSYL